MTVKYPIDTTGDPATVRLRATTDEGLLTTFASLTHRLHESPVGADRQDALRGQRGLVQAEILRRMAPTRTPAPGHATTYRLYDAPSPQGITGTWRCTCGSGGTSRDPEAAGLTHLFVSGA